MWVCKTARALSSCVGELFSSPATNVWTDCHLDSYFSLCLGYFLLETNVQTEAGLSPGSICILLHFIWPSSWGPAAEKHPHSMALLPPGASVLLLLCAVFCLHQFLHLIWCACSPFMLQQALVTQTNISEDVLLKADVQQCCLISLFQGIFNALGILLYHFPRLILFSSLVM